MDALAPLTPAQFCENTPPLERRTIRLENVEHLQFSQNNAVDVRFRPISLFCDNSVCVGVRPFDCTSKFRMDLVEGSANDELIYFYCRTCRGTVKTYAIRFYISGTGSHTMDAMKLGEYPGFGEPRPNQIKDVLDDELDWLARGYRAETSGLGIGAFAYYRRFVESHKNKIIAEIRKVAVIQGLDPALVAGLDTAAKTISFMAAIEVIKDAIPDSVKVDGQNPLTLLHDALSIGLHSEDDVECLALAHDIRVVLTALAERTTALLAANSVLKDSVKRLQLKKSQQTQPKQLAAPAAVSAPGVPPATTDGIA